MAQQVQLSLTTPRGPSVLTAKSGAVTTVRDVPFSRIEFTNPANGRSPGKAVSKRAGQDLVLEFNQDGEVVTVQLEDYYLNGGELVGVNEAGQAVAYGAAEGQVAMAGVADGGAASLLTDAATTTTAATTTATAFSMPVAVAAGGAALAVSAAGGSSDSSAAAPVPATDGADTVAPIVVQNMLIEGTDNDDTLTGGDGDDNLTSFEHVDLNGTSNQLSLTAADVLELTGAANPLLATLVVNGNSTNTVNATGFGAVVGAGVSVSVDVNGDGAIGGGEQFTTNGSGQITGDLGAGTQTYYVYNNASYGTLLVDSDIQRTIV